MLYPRHRDRSGYTRRLPVMPACRLWWGLYWGWKNRPGWQRRVAVAAAVAVLLAAWAAVNRGAGHGCLLVPSRFGPRLGRTRVCR